MWVKLKSKDANFEGGPRSSNVVVTASHGELTAEDRKKLSLFGLSRMEGDELDVEIWTQFPAIGARPLYLGPLLEKTFRTVRLNNDFSAMITGALQHPANTGQRDQSVPHAFDTKAGRKPLKVQATPSLFLANCDISDGPRQEFLEGAGWRPYTGNDGRIYRHFGSKPYFCRDPFIAGNLLPFVGPAALKRIKEARASSAKMIRISKSQDRPTDFSVPSPEGEDYLDFQAAGVDYALKTNASLLVADEMGLGKTITAIGILNGRRRKQKVVVFCEANMRVTWAQKLHEWLTIPHTIDIASGTFFPDTDIVIINYDIVSKNEDKLRSTMWDLQIFDEAHRLKNPASQRTMSLLGNVVSDIGEDDPGPIPLSQDGQRVMLTGTPQPNRVTELFPLISTLRPDIWGRGKAAYDAFEARYSPPFITKKGNKILVIPGKRERFETELQFRLRSTVMLRRLKRDTNLPPKMRQPLYIDVALSEADKNVLRQAEADLAAIREKHCVIIDEGNVTEAGPVIDMIDGMSEDSEEFHTIARIRRNLGVLKAPWAAEHLVQEMKCDDEVGILSKTIVFAHHAEVIDTVVERLRRDYPDGVVVYDGRTSRTAREDARERFQSDDQVRFFVGSSAAHTGITLTRSARVRFIEPDWSPSAMVQAEDRAWRIGQEQSVLVGYFMIPGTIDSTIGQSLVRKMKSIEKNLNTTEIDSDGYRSVDETSVQELEPAPLLQMVTPAPAAPEDHQVSENHMSTEVCHTNQPVGSDDRPSISYEEFSRMVDALPEHPESSIMADAPDLDANIKACDAPVVKNEDFSDVQPVICADCTTSTHASNRSQVEETQDTQDNVSGNISEQTLEDTSQSDRDLEPANAQLSLF